MVEATRNLEHLEELQESTEFGLNVQFRVKAEDGSILSVAKDDETEQWHVTEYWQQLNNDWTFAFELQGGSAEEALEIVADKIGHKNS